MSWAEIKKINSDFTKSLDELINEKVGNIVSDNNANKTTLSIINTNTTNIKNAFSETLILYNIVNFSLSASGSNTNKIYTITLPSVPSEYNHFYEFRVDDLYVLNQYNKGYSYNYSYVWDPAFTKVTITYNTSYSGETSVTDTIFKLTGTIMIYRKLP